MIPRHKKASPSKAGRGVASRRFISGQEGKRKDCGEIVPQRFHKRIQRPAGIEIAKGFLKGVLKLFSQTSPVYHVFIHMAHFGTIIGD